MEKVKKMNYVFISYASKNYQIAKKLEKEINKVFPSSFHAALVEDRKEGDTTFTEKVIKSFKKCNVFIVLLTSQALENQFVNQEWGYAKCLKELGQIQLLLHITEKSHKGERIKSNGFISTNMDFIDLPINKSNKPNTDKMVKEVIKFLKDKQEELIPILTDVQQKLKRLSAEIKKNSDLRDDLIKSEESYRKILSIEPAPFSKDYALQILQVGHFFSVSFINTIERYVERINELNIWKTLLVDWAICRGQYHSSNTNQFYRLLRGSEEIFNKIRQEVEMQNKLYSTS